MAMNAPEPSSPIAEPALYQWFAKYRLIILPVLDAGIWALALVVATLLRYQLNTDDSLTGGLLASVAIAIAAQLGIGFGTIFYRARWKVASFEEMAVLAFIIAATTEVVLIADFAFLHHSVPTSAILGAGAFAFIACAGYRGAWRLWHEFQIQTAPRAERVIVFGAGSGGQQVIDVLAAGDNSPFTAVGLLDDDPRKRHVRLRHLQVAGGRDSLKAVSERVKATMLIVAVPSATSELIRELSGLAVDCGLDVRVLPPVEDLLVVSKVSLSDIRPVTEVDLLGRHQIDTEVELISGYLSDRRVLVTGAGGSIGSELCRQIAQFAPAELVMLDHDESGLHGTQLSIDGRALLSTRSLVVCDIRDRVALQEAFLEHRPEVVFHAAALKHLSLLEMWPAEAIKTNVVGTRNVLDAAELVGSVMFVNISTDKAADPCSVLGYTKRVAERITAATAAESNGAYLSVRFGNVLGSRGSVLTTFRAQVKAGGPITVTHPDVTRYFMTVEEAVQLVIQAGAVGRTGEVLVLDMGNPVRINEVAERLASEAPDTVEIVYTGLRPGEKLHEDLFGIGEVDDRPVHPLISHVRVPPLDSEGYAKLTGPATSADLKVMLQVMCEGGRPNGTEASASKQPTVTEAVVQSDVRSGA
jgi:FlaA1/EpsC-like NDP-sugar epimerase